jgi:hypothetical protein
MIFDSLNTADCVVPQAIINGGPSSNIPDARCADSAFAAANPKICGSSYLIIKPSSALIMRLASMSFTVYEYANGVESQVIDGLIFTSSMPDIFLIGASSGSGTGLAKGTSTITVTRNGMSASASITVLDSTIGCSETSVKSLILIDTSRSSSLAFGGAYNTRLDFAKAAAEFWTNSIILVGGQPKDFSKVQSFSEIAADVTADYIGDSAMLATDINGVQQLLSKTDIVDALNAAIIDISTETADEKIIVLISDGEQTTGVDTQPALNAAAAFRAAGGIIVAIGLRASGSGFDLMERLASGGFFLNATVATAQDVLNGISFIRTATCTGICADKGDKFENRGQLDYSSFLNWEVIAGSVDLIGNGFCDFLPGNGLYVDMVGSSPYPQTNDGSTTPFGATIRTIDRFNIAAGADYTISFNAAGNNRQSPAAGIQSVKVFLRDPNAPDSDPNIFEHIVAPSWNSGFQKYSFTFKSPISANAKIYFQQILAVGRCGNLLDDIRLSDSSKATLLGDNFDSENPVYVPPNCGVGATYVQVGHTSTYMIGYNCYTECDPEIPLTQSQDPSPLPDIETGTADPQLYTSTKSFCASCLDGNINLPNAGLIPKMTSDTAPSGVAFASSVVNFISEWWAFDQILSTVWNTLSGLPQWIGYQFPSPQKVSSYSITSAKALSETSPVGYTTASPTAFTFEGSNDGSAWTVLDSESGLIWGINETKVFVVANPQSFTYYRVNVSAATSAQLTASIAAVQMFDAAVNQVCKQATATSYTSQQDADSKALSAATIAAHAALNCTQSYTSTQSYTAVCPLGNGTPVTKTSTQISLVSQAAADAAATAQAKSDAMAAIDCTGSNNGQQITINDFAAATPYPSAKFVSGFVGNISKVTVAIKGFKHSYPNDVSMLLVSPNGTIVNIMRNCGGQVLVSGVNIVFDDAAGGTINNATVASETYKPTQIGGFNTFPQPCPSGTPNTTLAAFIGQPANGIWALWVQDTKQLDVGLIAQGWDLTII